MLNEAQIKKLDDLLKYYDKYFYVIHERELEGYKWKALKVYNSDETNPSAESVCLDKLKESIKDNNLLDSRNKFVLLALIDKANDKANSKMQELFCQLIQGDRDTLEARLTNFMEKVNELKKQILPETKYKILVCDAMTCLAIIKPDKYYLYRPFVFEDAYLYFYDVKFKGNPIEKACRFHDLCDDILEYVSKKDDFLAKYKSYLKQNEGQYNDKSLHLLVQNIVYLLQYKPESFSEFYTLVDCDDIFTGGEFGESDSDKHRAGKFNLIQDMQENENRRHIGELGEDLVFKKLEMEDPTKKPDHVSLGNNYSPYDIKYDKTFIEVKTFSYQKKKNPSFYISQEEVKFSIKKAENYQLWFVIVDRNKKHWWYKIFDGDITKSINLEFSEHGEKYYYKFNEEQLKEMNCQTKCNS